MTVEMSDAERLELLRVKRARILELREQIRNQLQDHQKPPEDDWLIWVFLAGRGSGKTFAGMRWLNDQCLETKGLRARIIAPTQSDGVASCVEGPNGLLTASHGVATFHPSHPSGAHVKYPNGSRVYVVGTPTKGDVDRLRALTNIDVDVFEEFFANRQAQAAWDQAELSRRRGSRKAVVTSTPRPHQIHKDWQSDPDVVITRAKTSDNKMNDPKWVARQERKYKGTRLYQQEFLGLVLEDVEGALWRQSDIDRSLVLPEGFTRDQLIASLVKIIVGVDPASGPGTTGIVVVGIDEDKHLWVLDDYSIEDASPNQWALRLAQASADYGDALVVAEKNNGHRMVAEVIKNSVPNLPLDTVWASESKKARAEPLSVKWEAEYQTGHFCPPEQDTFVKLWDQLTSWVPGPTGAGQFSPDHLDAMVWAGAKLLEGSGTAEAHFPGSSATPSRGAGMMAARMGGY